MATERINKTAIDKLIAEAPELRAQKQAEREARIAAGGKDWPLLDLKFLWDEKLTGFGAKLTAAGNVVYLAQYRVKGSPKLQRFTIGKHGALWTADKARDRAQELIDDARRGIDPAAEIKRRHREAAEEEETRANRLTLSEFAPLYHDLAKRYGTKKNKAKKPRTIAEDNGLIRRYLMPELGAMKMDDITTTHVDEMHRKLHETPVAANRAVSLLSHMLNIAMKAGKAAKRDNPCAQVTMYEEKQRKPRLTRAQMLKLGKALAARFKTEHPSAVAALMVLMMTGARKMEIVAAKRDWLDRENKCLWLPDSKTDDKPVALPDLAIKAIDLIPEVSGNPYLFPGIKPTRHIVGVQKIWERVRKDAGLQKFRIHDMRHIFATTAVQSRESLYLTGKALGHKRASTTERYADADVAPLFELSNRTAITLADQAGIGKALADRKLKASRKWEKRRNKTKGRVASARAASS